MEAKQCACEIQIVWYFDKPTVIVCEKCERTLHFTHEKCPVCGGELTYFVKEELGV